MTKKYYTPLVVIAKSVYLFELQVLIFSASNFKKKYDIHTLVTLSLTIFFTYQGCGISQ